MWSIIIGCLAFSRKHTPKCAVCGEGIVPKLVSPIKV